MKRKLMTVALILSGLGLTSLASAYKSAVWSDPQSALYNQGLDAYANQDFKSAAQLFQQSVDLCNAPDARTVSDTALVPPLDAETCALSSFQLGKALIAAEQKPEDAAAAFQTAIKQLTDLAHNSPGKARLFLQEALFAQYDYELLRKSKPTHTKPSSGDGKDPKPATGNKSDNQVPNNGDPSNGAGKGSGNNTGL